MSRSASDRVTNEHLQHEYGPTAGENAETTPSSPHSGMNERRRPPRRGRGQRPSDRAAGESGGEPNPYRDEPAEVDGTDTPAPRRSETATDLASPAPPPPSIPAAPEPAPVTSTTLQPERPR